MVNLLESMHKCCLPSGVPTESPSAYEKSLVHKIFGGRLRSQVAVCVFLVELTFKFVIEKYLCLTTVYTFKVYVNSSNKLGEYLKHLLKFLVYELFFEICKYDDFV